MKSARDFSRRFNRWHFPSRRDKLSAEEEERLVSRVKQLWEANYMQKQMLDVLVDEGWQLDDLRLARFRRKHGIMLRVAGGYNRENMGPGTGKKRKRDAEDETDGAIMDAPRAEPTIHDNASAIDMDPATAARRMQRLVDIQADSDAQFNARKRRRRIRGYAHLPPDAPGLPPRYRSETSLDECKAYLSLSNDLYKEIRQKFEDICTEMDIIKKGLCNDGDWDKAKNRLIRESTHLSAVLNPVHENLAARENALEVLCADVTKRMRVMKKRIFLKQANNILGLNPEQSKELRRQFYEILKADGFQTKLLCGKEHWAELKQQWYDSSEVVQQLHAQGVDDEKKKCIDVLLRDAMKRHNDNNVTKIPHLSQQNASGPGPGPAKRSKNDREATQSSRPAAVPSYEPIRHSDLDPALFAALASEVTPATAAAPTARMTAAQSVPQDHAQTQPVPRHAIPAYFRLSIDSSLHGQHPRMWLAAINGADVASLYAAATSKAKSARVMKICGVVKDADGREDQYQIDGSDELEAYLETINEIAAGKATFVVVLGTGSA